MSKTKLFFSILAVLFGPFLFVFGGYDDSPGAQGLGLLIFLFGITSIVRGRKKK